jgi:sulfur transfer protein SufE
MKDNPEKIEYALQNDEDTQKKYNALLQLGENLEIIEEMSQSKEQAKKENRYKALVRLGENLEEVEKEFEKQYEKERKPDNKD